MREPWAEARFLTQDAPIDTPGDPVSLPHEDRAFQRSVNTDAAALSTAEQQRSLAGRAARSTVWNVASQVAQTAMGLVGFWILSHFLGPADYGIVGMASTVTAALGAIGDAGIVSGLIRARDAGPTNQASAFWLALGAACGLSAAAVLAAPVLGAYYREPGVMGVAVALGLGFLLAAPGRVSTALLSRGLQFRALAVSSVASNALGLGAAWWAAARGAGPWALALQTLVTFAVQSGLLLLQRRYAVSPRLVSREASRSLGAFSWRISAFSFLAFFARSGDVVIGGRWLGPVAPGLLVMALRLAQFPVQRLSAATAGVFLSAVARLEGEEQTRAYGRVLRLVLLMVAPFAACVFAAAPEIVAVLPARWAGLEPVLRAVAAGSVMEPVGTLAWAVLAAADRPEVLLRFSFVFFPVAWLDSFLGSASGSATGLAVAWAVTTTVAALGLVVLMRRTAGPTHLEPSHLARPLLTALAVAAVARVGVDAMGLARSGAGLAAGLAIALGVYAAALATICRDDVRTVLRIVRHRA